MRAAEDLEDQVLLLETDVIGDALFLGDLVQLVHVHRLEVFDVELAALDLLVLGVGLGVEVGDIFGDGRLAIAAIAGLFGSALFLDGVGGGINRDGGFGAPWARAPPVPKKRNDAIRRFVRGRPLLVFAMKGLLIVN